MSATKDDPYNWPSAFTDAAITLAVMTVVLYGMYLIWGRG